MVWPDRFGVVEQPLHHRRQAPRADVLGALVHVERDLRERRTPSG
jgi:hypothetical protein